MAELRDSKNINYNTRLIFFDCKRLEVVVSIFNLYCVTTRSFHNLSKAEIISLTSSNIFNTLISLCFNPLLSVIGIKSCWIALNPSQIITLLHHCFSRYCPIINNLQLFFSRASIGNIFPKDHEHFRVVQSALQAYHIMCSKSSVFLRIMFGCCLQFWKQTKMRKVRQISTNGMGDKRGRRKKNIPNWTYCKMYLVHDILWRWDRGFLV